MTPVHQTRKMISRSFRLSETEFLELKDRAKKKQQSLSSFLRSQILWKQPPSSSKDANELKQLLAKWLSAFNRHGHELNDIAATYERGKRDEIGLTAYFYGCSPIIDALTVLLSKRFRIVVNDHDEPHDH